MSSENANPADTTPPNPPSDTPPSPPAQPAAAPVDSGAAVVDPQPKALTDATPPVIAPPADATPAAPPQAPASAAASAPVVKPAPAVIQESLGEKRVSLPLAFVSIAFVTLALLLFVKDIRRMQQDKGGIAPALAMARERMSLVEDTSNGWFPAPRDPIFSWDDDAQGWTYEAGSPALPTFGERPSGPAVQVATQAPALQVGSLSDHPARGNLLAVPVSFPDPATILRETSLGPTDPHKLHGIRFIAYDVYVPKNCPGFVGCLFFLKDKDGLWYQARTRAAMVPGEWTTVTADIRGDSPDVTPLGHLGQWDDNQASKVRMVGLTFYGDKKWSGKIHVDNLRGWMRPQRFKQVVENLVGGTIPTPIAPEKIRILEKLLPETEKFKEDAVQVINFRTDPPAPTNPDGQASSPPMVRKFETLTLRFELNRQIDNPFDPEKCDVTCIVESKSGRTTEHVGFWFQDYDRNERFVTDELRPMGRPEWRVRITPREEGEHIYRLRVKLKGEAPLELPPQTFFCMPSDGKGFVRISKTDSRYFEFENGEFFYPVGHNISSPVDIRCWKEVFKQDPPAGRGLPMYRDFFDKMQKNGENTVEVWMASWWLGIEWTSRWRDFYGAGRYSLQNAWKLDYLLDMARDRGIYVHLVIDNHGKFSAWCDWEWDNNPYNINSPGDNGVVHTAEEFFTDPTCRKWHKNKLRYIAARWGANSTVLGWELVSEYDLVGGTGQVVNRQAHPRMVFHRSPVLQTWAREMIGYLRQTDPYGRPITNHYATDYKWIDVDLARESLGVGQPLFDYVVTDVYRPVEKRYMQAALDNQKWFNSYLVGEARKPFWITEYGGDFNAAPPAFLHSDVHCGLWATWMTEGAGTPLFWWYDFIDQNNLYTYYKAFSNYIKGEDRRGLNGLTVPMTVTAGGGSGAVVGYCYRWPNGAYGWVYNDAAMRSMPPEEERPRHESVETVIAELSAGTYKIEYWDCYEGRVVNTETAEVVAGKPLRLKFPPFVNNMAVKVKKQ
ncbi:MAG TPA: DUF5060 domain-containing protein [Planctomycetota bacterium]|nr:DUF5060 domain-containing protein [Planctomycetota bacterium]